MEIKVLCESIAVNNYNLGFSDAMLKISALLAELKGQAETGLDHNTLAEVRKRIGEIKGNPEEVARQFQ